MNNEILQHIKDDQVIAAIKTNDEINSFISSNLKVAFLLGGDIFEIQNNVELIKSANKFVFVHLDLVDGLNKDAKAVKLLAQIVKPHGILTTKNALIKTIKDFGILAGQRCFILDSQSYNVAIKSVISSKPDIVEIMPAIMPRIIKRMSEEIKHQTLVIAGGLIETKNDVQAITKAGASGISTSKTAIW